MKELLLLVAGYGARWLQVRFIDERSSRRQSRAEEHRRAMLDLADSLESAKVKLKHVMGGGEGSRASIMYAATAELRQVDARWRSSWAYALGHDPAVQSLYAEVTRKLLDVKEGVDPRQDLEQAAAVAALIAAISSLQDDLRRRVYQ